jgi:hypothetical protein
VTGTTGPETGVTISRIFNRGLLNLVEVNLPKINIQSVTEIV